MFRLPQDPTPEQLEKAYEAGMLRKTDLKHGAYYRGFCRNAKVARWHESRNVFIHWRTKFNSTFLERISHAEDEPNFDVFIAIEEITPEGDELIDDEKFETLALSDNKRLY